MSIYVLYPIILTFGSFISFFFIKFYLSSLFYPTRVSVTCAYIKFISIWFHSVECCFYASIFLLMSRMGAQMFLLLDPAWALPPTPFVVSSHRAHSTLSVAALVLWEALRKVRPFFLGRPFTMYFSRKVVLLRQIHIIVSVYYLWTGIFSSFLVSWKKRKCFNKVVD